MPTYTVKIPESHAIVPWDTKNSDKPGTFQKLVVARLNRHDPSIGATGTYAPGKSEVTTEKEIDRNIFRDLVFDVKKGGRRKSRRSRSTRRRKTARNLRRA